MLAESDTCFSSKLSREVFLSSSDMILGVVDVGKFIYRVWWGCEDKDDETETILSWSGRNGYQDCCVCMLSIGTRDNRDEYRTFDPK